MIGRSLVGDAPMFENDLFPWVRSLERYWHVVQCEAADVLKYHHVVPALEAVSSDHGYLACGGEWQSFFLWGYGYRSDANCRHFPMTAALVGAIPGLKTAMFSIHAPGLYIPPHKGVTKGMLTCHLGLVVPRDREGCAMRLDGRIAHGQEGRALIFGDTYRHEVWNRTGGDRVILLLQFARPLDLTGKIMSNLFLAAVRWSPFIGDARRNMRRWTTEFEQSDREQS